MGKYLSKADQCDALRLLVEGNSIRSTERLTGVHRDTIMRLVVRFGNACRDFLDESLRNLSLQHVQCDEIWTFVQKKQARVMGRELHKGVTGDMYLYTALDTDSKLLVTFALGKRSTEITRVFIRDLESRMVRPPVTMGQDRPQISTDGFSAYQTEIAHAFNGTVRHGVLIKNYVDPEVGRYAPPKLRRAERVSINGINDLGTICTSHVERNNLTIRTFMKRFTRLTCGFSKKKENLAAATALHVAHYNFCRIHGTLKCTPAMRAGIVPTLWGMEDLYDAVMDRIERKKKAARIEKLLKRLCSET